MTAGGKTGAVAAAMIAAAAVGAVLGSVQPSEKSAPVDRASIDVFALAVPPPQRPLSANAWHVMTWLENPAGGRLYASTGTPARAHVEGYALDDSTALYFAAPPPVAFYAAGSAARIAISGTVDLRAGEALRCAVTQEEP